MYVMCSIMLILSERPKTHILPRYILLIDFPLFFITSICGGSIFHEITKNTIVLFIEAWNYYLYSHKNTYNHAMNILKNLLLSFEGKIGRADYIYGIVYVVLLGLVSADVFIEPEPIRLIGGGIDFGSLFQYIFSIAGCVFFFWSFFAVTTKRLRALNFDIRYSAIGLLFPFALVVWLLPDTKKFTYNNPLSLADHIFFYTLVAICIVALFTFYRLSLFVRFALFLTVAISWVMIYLFWKDKRDFHGKNRLKYTGIDAWIDLGFVLVIVFFVRSFVLSPFQIIGPSMESTFHGGAIAYTAAEWQTYSDGEFILVDKMSYHFSDPLRGDVVVFSPGIGPEKRYLIKRVIGTPGDKVKIENGYVFVAKADHPEIFVRLNESMYLQEKFGHTCLNYSGVWCDKESQTFVVPAGRYFLMGDNRPQSLDARKCFSNSGCIGDYRLAQFVPLSQIQGRVAYSLGHFDLLSQILPYPKIGTLKEVIPYRGLAIQNTHTYTELR